MVNVGVLWDSEVDWDRETPFNYAPDESYAYFSELADEEGVELFMAKYTWYSDGDLDKAWRFDDGWKKVKDIELDAAQDKFKSDEGTLELKRKISKELAIINDPELEILCKDKLRTFERFQDYTPETRKASENNIEAMLEEYGKIVLKPRRAYGAEGIYVIEEGEEIPGIENGEYIVQRYIDSSDGIKRLVDGSHDLRGIVVNGTLLGAYIRYNEDSEISNVSEGGTKKALSLEEFPEDAKEIVQEVNDELDYSPAIFSVDLFYDEEGQPWIVELNGKPGLNFFGDEEVKKQVTPIMKELLECYKELAY
jgi:glutathione synthase/RimK-type ligase-like ATP-grasp enzyme